MDGVGKDAAIGFFSTEVTENVGITGGYLLLNLSGRPLEFHCSLPIRPSRAHEILYGPTLRPFLIGERIGPALIQRTRLKPLLVCIDSLEAAPLQASLDAPLVLVEPAAGEDHQALTGPSGVERLQPVGDDLTQVETIRKALARITEPLDLCEPFTRIREALREAQQSATRAA